MSPTEWEDAGGPRSLRQETRVLVVLFWASVLVPLAVHLVEARVDTGSLAAVALLVAGVVWLHVLFHVQDLEPGDLGRARSVVLPIGLYVVFAALLSIHEIYLLGLFGVYSITFAFAGTLRRGLILSLVPTAIWMVAWLMLGFPAVALLTPLFVWITSNVIAYFTGRIAATSEERRRLLGELHATRRDLAEEERRRGTLEERARMAAEIHDTVAQGYTGIVVLAQATAGRINDLPLEAVTASLRQIEATARDNLTEARRLVDALHPPELDGGGLDPAIRTAAQRHEATTGATVRVSTVGESSSLGSGLDLVVLRAVQEALANAAKHASARAIDIVLTYTADDVTVAVADDGAGFGPGTETHTVAGLTGGQGLDLLRRRVEQAGGILSVRSRPGAGTELTASIPLPRTASRA